ncbi:transcriptional repressor [bacterium]|nr:transcriptional repressor [bacterium]
MQQERHMQESLDQFFSACREAGLRITPQRSAIYKAVLEHGDHPTASEIHKWIARDMPHVSIDTVNRTLHSFHDMGLLNIVEGEGGPRRFDPNTRSHHHLHCDRCGKIIDFYSDAADNMPIPPEVQNDFIVERKRIVLSGICRECMNANDASGSGT